MDKIAALIDTPLAVHNQSRLRQVCLERDGFRCMASGTIGESPPLSSTRLTHIIPIWIGKSEETQQVLSHDFTFFGKRLLFSRDAILYRYGQP